jgi:hypothetical protein
MAWACHLIPKVYQNCSCSFYYHFCITLIYHFGISLIFCFVITLISLLQLFFDVNLIISPFIYVILITKIPCAFLAIFDIV